MTRNGQTAHFPNQSVYLPAATIADLYRCPGKWNFFQVDQAAPANQGLLGTSGKRGKDSNLDRRLGYCAGGDCQEENENRADALHILQILSLTLLRKCPCIKPSRGVHTEIKLLLLIPAEIIRSLTGHY